MAGSETNIGGIVGFLRLDATEFHREIQQALLETESLTNKDVRVSVKTDGAAGLERLPRAASAARKSVDELTASERRLEDATKRVNIAQLKLSELNESGKAKASQLMTAQMAVTRAQRDELDASKALEGVKASLAQKTEEVASATERQAAAHEQSSKALGENRQQMGLLQTAIITLGPALVPIAAGAVGLAGGFAAMGVAGLVAFKGIKDAMAQNNAVGQAYQRGLAGLSAALDKLAATAAGNILAPFQAAVADIQAKMPQLSSEVDEFSTMAGKAASSLVQGLVNGFVQLEPMLRTAAVYVVDLTQKFEAMMSGPGIQSFGSYVQSVIPQVTQTLGSLWGASSNLVQSFAPLGGGVLTAVNGLADGIKSLNPDLLTAVSTAAGSVAIGFKAWQGLAGLATGLGSAMRFLGASAETAAAGMRVFTAAAGIIGVAIAALSVGFTLVAEHNRNMQQATDDYTEALIKSNGVIDENVRKSALQHAEADGTIKDAQELGLSVNDLVDAYLGIPGASEKVRAAYEAQHIALASQKGELADTAFKIDHLDGVYSHLTGEIGDSAQQMEASKVAYQHQKEVADAAAGATQGLDQANQDLANRYGWSLTTFDQVTTGQQKMAQQTEITTAKMQEQNDAAGLLKLQLDELNGKQISNLEAQDAYARAGNNLGKPMKQAQDALAAAQKQQAGLSDGQVSPGAQAAVGTAQKNLAWRQQQLDAVRNNSKHTAAQLATAEHNVQVATDRLTAAQGKANTVTGAATQAQRDAAAAAIAQAQAQIAAARSLTGNSEAAIQNRENILSMVKMGNAAVGTSQNLAQTNEGARQKLIQVRENIVKQGVAAGMNEKDIRSLLDTIDQVPDQPIKTTYQADTEPAKKDTREWVGVINGVPTWKDTTFKVKTADALAAVANIREAIEGVRDHTVTISAVYSALGQQAALSAHNALMLDAHGVPNWQAAGSIRMDGVQKMAEGGFPGRQSTIMRSTKPILWNEAPGGEAYISLAPQKRARSLAIHEEVGRILGAGGGASSRMHPEDIRAIGKELALAVRSMPTPRVDLDEFNRRLV